MQLTEKLDSLSLEWGYTEDPIPFSYEIGMDQNRVLMGTHHLGSVVNMVLVLVCIGSV